MNTAIRIINALILAGILWVLIDIRWHMPPTLGERIKLGREATQAQKNMLLLRQPMAVPVEVHNTPLEVQIDE